MICSSEVRAIHSSRARLRLTHLCRADQPNHVRTVVSSTLEIFPVDVVLTRGARQDPTSRTPRCGCPRGGRRARTRCSRDTEAGPGPLRADDRPGRRRPLRRHLLARTARRDGAGLLEQPGGAGAAAGERRRGRPALGRPPTRTRRAVASRGVRADGPAGPLRPHARSVPPAWWPGGWTAGALVRRAGDAGAASVRLRPAASASMSPSATIWRSCRSAS